MRNPRAVVVDDNPINLELATFLLESAGFDVEGVEDSATAIARIRASAPDVVLMDIQMPGVDGLALAARLKADPATAGLAIIACTAYAMKGDEAKMRAAGCDGYISKPLDVATFAASVRSHLGPLTR
jgi:two-component system, cell cycle response regulator DivK